MITFLDRDKMTYEELVIIQSLDKKYSFISRSVRDNNLHVWEYIKAPDNSGERATSTLSVLFPYPDLFSFIEPGKIYNLAFIEGNEYE